jgi:tetratricopeptide (TPR) repeat protein
MAATIGYGQTSALSSVSSSLDPCRATNCTDAVAFYRTAITAERKTPHPDDARIAVWLNELGVASRRMGRYKDAEAAYRESIALTSGRADGDLPLAGTLTNLAELLRLEGKLNEARESAMRALAVREGRLPPERVEIAETLNNLGAVLAAGNDFDGAVRQYSRALSICDRIPETSAAVRAATLHNLGVARFRLGQTAEAEAALRRALEFRERTAGPAHPDTLDTLANLAQLTLLMGRWNAAEAYYTRLYKAVSEAGPGGDQGRPARITALEGLALVYRSLGRLTECERTYSDLIDALQSRTMAPDFKLAAAREGLADLYAHEQRYTRAAVLYESAVHSWEQEGTSNTGLARVLGKYAIALRKLRRDSEAAAAERRASDILLTPADPQH